jgi:hypothetical protein
MIIYYFLNTTNYVFKIFLKTNFVTTINLIIYNVYGSLAFPRQGGGTATQSPAERFQSSSTLGLGLF